MLALDPITSRLGARGWAATALVGGVVAVWALFAVGAGVWYGLLPPGSFLLTLLLVFLAVVLVMPVPESGPDPEPHPVWQREMERADRGEDDWRTEETWSDDESGE